MEITSAIAMASFSLRIPEERVRRIAEAGGHNDQESLLQAIEREIREDPASFLDYAHNEPHVEADM